MHKEQFFKLTPVDRTSNSVETDPFKDALSRARWSYKNYLHYESLGPTYSEFTNGNYNQLVRAIQDMISCLNHSISSETQRKRLMEMVLACAKDMTPLQTTETSSAEHVGSIE